jgi:hypothetical protein
MEEVEKNLLLLLPLATKPSTFSFSFHWPPSFGSTFTYLLLLFKRRTWMIGGALFFFLGETTSNWIWRNISSYKFLRRKRMISLGSGEEGGEYNGNLVIVLKEWRWVMIDWEVGTLEEAHKPSRVL